MTDISEKISRLLDEYEESVGLKKWPVPLSSERFMSAGHEEISKMSPEELGDGSLSLAQYSMYIQRQQNREQAVMRYCEENLRAITAKQCSQVAAGSYQERLALAIDRSDLAKDILRVKVLAQARFDDLNYLSGRIDRLSLCYLELSKTRRASNGRA